MRLSTQLELQPRYFAISLTPLRHTKTLEVYGVIGVFHDISDIKLTEQIRIDFVGNASHELRTPLTTVKGYIETLKQDLQDKHYDQALQFTEIVSKNVDRLIELVSDLLSLSTLESNPELNLELMEPLKVSEQVIAELARLALEKHQVIRVIGQVPPFLADIRKVEQVLRNLVQNAIKYIPEGKSIQIRWEPHVDGRVALRVIDDGPGIPLEHHSRLFERFYRIDRGRARDMGGTGLGLAIVKHIMMIHGGQVQLKSQLGQGSEFICYFPDRGLS
jgi:two-component system phosphate regulon sensor histidine kinase PhoR